MYVAGVRDFDYVDDRDDYEIVSIGSLSSSNWWTEGDPPPLAERTWVRRTVFSGPTGVSVYETLSFPYAETPASDTDGDGTVTMADVQTLVASWGLQVCCGTSDGDVDGDGGVGAGDMTIVLTNFGLAAESVTCDPDECGPGIDLTPLQKCRRYANRRFWKCATVVVGTQAAFRMLFCAAVCGGSIIIAPPLAPAACVTCLHRALGLLGATVFGCATDWFLNYTDCDPL